MNFIQKPTGNPYSTWRQLVIPLTPNEDGGHDLILTLVRAQDGKCRGYLDHKAAGHAPEEYVAVFDFSPHLFVPITGAPERLVDVVVKAQAVPMVHALERLLSCIDGMDSYEFDSDFAYAQRQARLTLEAAKSQT